MLCGTASGYITLSGYARRIVTGGNAVAILGSALGTSANRGAPGTDDLGEGPNVIGVWGEVASASSAGVYGVNWGSLDDNDDPIGGPGVQGDTVAIPGSIGILGVADSGGTSGNPNRAVEGRAVAAMPLPVTSTPISSRS